MMKRTLAFLACVIAGSAYATNIPMHVAVLRGLDKVTGRTSTFSIPVGESAQFGKIFISPEACYTHPPEESPENAAFLYIYEKSAQDENVELFKGWMFSSSPALSAMEDPVYDVWVLECVKDPKKAAIAQPVDHGRTEGFDIYGENYALPVQQEEMPITSEDRKELDDLNLVPTRSVIEELR